MIARPEILGILHNTGFLVQTDHEPWLESPPVAGQKEVVQEEVSRQIASWHENKPARCVSEREHQDNPDRGRCSEGKTSVPHQPAFERKAARKTTHC